VSAIGCCCVKTNSLHTEGGDVVETKGVPLGHDKSLVKGVTTTSKEMGHDREGKCVYLKCKQEINGQGNSQLLITVTITSVLLSLLCIDIY